MRRIVGVSPERDGRRGRATPATGEGGTSCTGSMTKSTSMALVMGGGDAARFLLREEDERRDLSVLDADLEREEVPGITVEGRSSTRQRVVSRRVGASDSQSIVHLPQSPNSPSTAVPSLPLSALFQLPSSKPSSTASSISHASLCRGTEEDGVNELPPPRPAAAIKSAILKDGSSKASFGRVSALVIQARQEEMKSGSGRWEDAGRERTNKACNRSMSATF